MMNVSTKFCAGCETTKSVTAFNTNKTKQDGLQTQCKECRAAYNRLHYKKNKAAYRKSSQARTDREREFWRDYKSQLKCSTCGEDHIACLEFHHTDPAVKEYNVSLLINNGCSRKTVEAEIENVLFYAPTVIVSYIGA